MRITKFHFQVLRTQDVKGDVRSLEGDGTLLRPLLKITSGKNLLSDCLGVDYSVILLLLLLFIVGIYVCHTTYLFVDTVAYPGLGSAILIEDTSTCYLCSLLWATKNCWGLPMSLRHQTLLRGILMRFIVHK